MKLDTLGTRIALILTILSVILIAFNLVSMTGNTENPINNLIDGDNDKAPERDTEEKEEPDYYDKAQEESTENSDNSKSLNLTEETNIENDFEGYVNSSGRNNGLYLDRKAVAGERNSVQVVVDGEPIKGTEVLVNGNSIGETSRWGDVFFEVPEADTIVIRTTTENLGTVEHTFEVY